jgi:hypothetical protein
VLGLLRLVQLLGQGLDLGSLANCSIRIMRIINHISTFSEGTDRLSIMTEPKSPVSVMVDFIEANPACTDEDLEQVQSPVLFLSSHFI